MKVVYTRDDHGTLPWNCSVTKEDGEVFIVGPSYAVGCGRTPEEAKADLQKHLAINLELEYRKGIQMLNAVTRSEP